MTTAGETLKSISGSNVKNHQPQRFSLLKIRNKIRLIKKRQRIPATNRESVKRRFYEKQILIFSIPTFSFLCEYNTSRFESTHVEAPYYGSIILASIILKLGGYGILRLIQTNRRLIFVNKGLKKNMYLFSFEYLIASLIFDFLALLNGSQYLISVISGRNNSSEIIKKTLNFYIFLFLIKLQVEIPQDPVYHMLGSVDAGRGYKGNLQLFPKDD
ncbi:NADH-ubiquinone oxidoreductase chain [Apis cerana cerana]|uniref:NADH-ubiquinone oxidoreductase chain n=1 Tax=Apis cerana cerana TaxID=94128 RepID=A0A2A3E508_APICC|nr:NADH-ubiquinone oxidoreductase chain [Apis cerana cerana]